MCSHFLTLISSAFEYLSLHFFNLPKGKNNKNEGEERIQILQISWASFQVEQEGISITGVNITTMVSIPVIQRYHQ
jgi:hypothetical protein